MGTVNQLFLRAIFNSYVKLPEGIKYQTAMRAMKVSNRLKMLDSGDYCTELFKKWCLRCQGPTELQNVSNRFKSCDVHQSLFIEASIYFFKKMLLTKK